MNTSQSNRVNMIRTVVQFCDDNVLVTAAITAFANVLAIVKNKLVLIDQLNQIAVGKTKGVTSDTRAIRATMTDIAFKCASALSAYADSVHNNTLKTLVDYPLSDLQRLRKEEVDDVCQTIHDAANTHIAAAGAFGYVLSDVTDLQTAIDLFRPVSQNPRQAVIARKTANKNVTVLINDITLDFFKQQMDRMAKTLKSTAPDFVTGYFSAREVINLGTSITRIIGAVQNATSSPLYGVLVHLQELNGGTHVYETYSHIDGTFILEGIHPADYTITYSLATYETQTTAPIHFAAGATISQTVTMKLERKRKETNIITRRLETAFI